MSLAVIAGQGALPAAVKSACPEALICGLDGQALDLPVDLRFRLETLGGLIATLRARGVTQICFAGAMARMPLDPAQIDAETRPLVPRILAALHEGGDDAALRAAAALFEEQGITLVGAHDLAPDLLPPEGVLSGDGAPPEAEAAHGMQILDHLSAADLGQGCVIRGTRVLAVEAAFGTDWMLRSLADQAQGGVFVKAPKTGQDLRFDMPAIGPGTVAHAQRAGLRAIVIQAGGVIVLERAQTLAAAQDAGLMIWVRG